MKVDETYTPKVRRNKSIQELEEIGIENLVKRFSYKEIAEIYNLSEVNVWYLLRQHLYNKINKKESLQELPDEFTKEDYTNSIGAWMNSKERQSYLEIKKNIKHEQI